jgi:rubrerythrin
LAGWNGETLPDFPNLKAFDGKGTIAEVLLQAMNLEKGADRLYTSMLQHFEGRPQHETIAMLAKAEEAHGRAVYGALRKLGERQLDGFESVYENLRGDILEGGVDVEELVGVAKTVASRGTVALLEIAVELELRAYDVYRSLAHRADDSELRETFLSLAEQEKRHARSLLKALGEAAT